MADLERASAPLVPTIIHSTPAPWGRSSAELAAVTAALAESLDLRQSSVDATVQAVAEAAVGSIPGAEHGGILLLHPDGSADCRAATSDLPLSIGTLLDETGEGPCLYAAQARVIVRIDDAATETRWPDYVTGARQLGVASVLCLPLSVNHEHYGSMSLYSARPLAFGADAEVLGAVFAAHAAAAMTTANQARQLRKVIDSRDVIGQAKGILMERHHLTADEAFAVLVDLSQTTNTKLRVVAEHLTNPKL